MDERTFPSNSRGYHESAESEKALKVALALGDSTNSNSKVLVLAFARPSEPEMSGKVPILLNEAREQLKQMLSQLRDRVQQSGIKIETRWHRFGTW